MDTKIPSVVYLTNIPAPYRERMHEIIEEQKTISYTVIYCTRLEPNRIWKINLGNYRRFFLNESATTFQHNNFNVWKTLSKLKPDVIIITAFKPTMLYGIAWAIFKSKKIIVFVDGTFRSESEFSFFKKLVRKITFLFSPAFIGPSKGTFELYSSYGIPESKMFKSCLCIDNARFKNPAMEDREFHIMFSGQIVEGKMPLFFAEVAKGLKNKIPELKVLIVGDGVERSKLLDALKELDIDFTFTGFLDQELLPSYYSKTKLFLFPTVGDAWGIVANEACASGTPVLTCQNAGAAGDLIVSGLNGYVLPLEADVWIANAYHLLSNPELLASFSINAIEMVQPFNHNQAADGIINAVQCALRKRKK